MLVAWLIGSVCNVDKDNVALTEKLEWAKAQRQSSLPTVPSTIEVGAVGIFWGKYRLACFLREAGQWDVLRL
jgi:hypothetical protein